MRRFLSRMLSAFLVDQLQIKSWTQAAKGSCRLLGHVRGKEYTESLGKLKWESLELRRKYLSWSYCAIFYWDIVT